MDKELESQSESSFVFEISPHEDIAAAHNALSAVDGMDTAVMSNRDKIKVTQIKRWALRIIHSALKDIYDSTQEGEEGED